MRNNKGLYTRGIRVMVYINFNTMLADAIGWCRTLTNDFDVVVAIPRSGLVLATMIATKFDKPLSTVDVFLEDKKCWIHDRRMTNLGFIPPNPSSYKRILLVDDTSSSSSENSTMTKNYNIIKAKYPELEIIKAALYITPWNAQYIDRYYKIIDVFPHRFEWNMLHAPLWNIALAVDLDGVLCKNCPVDDSNEEAYINWMKNAEPYLIPHYKINWIITCRIEKYRAITEEWLKKYGVEYGQLIMMDAPENKLRGDPVEFKAKVLTNLPQFPNTSWLHYWESDWIYAEPLSKILEGYRIFIICTQNMKGLGVTQWEHP